MTTQIVIIHGGNAFNTYEEYVADLRASLLTLERLRGQGWKNGLSDALGEGYEVLQPRMPNERNAKYLEWVIWFLKLTPLLDPEVIFVGHSLGGIFLAKYLSENIYPKKITATYLIAAPFNTDTKHPLADFVVSENLSLFAKQGGKIVLYHSKDDEVVPYENVVRYRHALPNAELRTFNDRQHFNQEMFPELVDDIKEVIARVHK